MRHKFNRSTRLFLVSTLLNGFAFSVWDLFFNLYILSLGFSSDMLGLIRSATPLAALLLGLPMGILSDRMGRRTSMLLGLGVGFIGMFFEIRLLNPWLIFAFGLVQGVGFMLYRVAQPPFIMAASKPEQQALIFSLNFGLLTVAATIGNLVAGQVPRFLETWGGIPQGSAASYQWVITAGILLAATSIIPIFLIREPKPAEEQPAAPLPLKTILRKITRRPIIRQLTLINVMIGFGAAFLVPYINVFLRQKFAIPDDLLGIIFSLSSMLVFAGSLASSWLVKITHSRILPTVATQSISILFLFTLGFSPFLWLAVLSLLMRAMLMQMSFPLLDNFTMLISPPEERGTITSLRGVGWQSGQAAGLFISGLVQTRFGFSPLFITTGLLYAVATFLTWALFRPEERRLADSAPA